MMKQIFRINYYCLADKLGKVARPSDNSPANIKLSKIQIYRITQIDGFLGSFVKCNKNLIDKKSNINDFYRDLDKTLKKAV